MPEEVMPASLGLASQTLNVSSFHGCIRNLYINHELQDFTRSHMKPGVVPGCQACRKLYCLHGICQPNAAQVRDSMTNVRLEEVAQKSADPHQATGGEAPTAMPPQLPDAAS